MSIQLSPPTPGYREAARPQARQAPIAPPRVLQSARIPAQLSFYFKRG